MNPADRTSSVPVAIIGMGCLFPKAENLNRYWANICQGVDAIREIPASHWNPDDYFDADPKSPDRTYARRGGLLDPVDFPALEFGIAPTNLDATDTTQLLGLMVARAALEDAGYGAGGKTVDRERVSVVLGVTGTLELVIPLGARLGHPIWRRALEDCGVAEPVASQVVQRIADSYVGWQENSFPGLLGNVAAGRIANRLDLGGTNCVVDAACASSIAAVHLAILELAAGRCDVALTGGLDTFNDIFMYMCFSKTPALSPTGDSRPFSAASDGTALGEGLGVLTLKRLDDARRDGDRIYAVIKGIGASSDGKGNAVYAPSAEGQARCLRSAYAEAGVSPETIELVEAHGTGTKVGDAVELSALTEVYRSSKSDGTWCALGSVKSQIGHTKSAAGAAGLIKAALALHHKVLPPTIKVDQPAEGALPGKTPFYVNTQSRPWMPKADHPRRAAVSAFGFGGSNFHAVLEEADSVPAPVAWTGDVQIFSYSGANASSIRAALDAVPIDASWEILRAEAARSRSAFQQAHAERLVIVAERDGKPWPKLAERARELLDSPPSAPIKAIADAIYRVSGPRQGGLAVLFPGQGSQYVGMLRELACVFPAVLETLAVAGREPLDDRNLVDWIYPHPVFDDAARASLEAALKDTRIAQPALGAVGLGAYRVLEQFGLNPQAFAGHSFGELTALCASGRISEHDFHDLARLRGQLMAGDGGERGGMLAVLAPMAMIEEVLVESKLDLVIANRNAPLQSVLSGLNEEILRASEIFQVRGITTKILDVSAAFHSRLVADASGPLLEALSKVEIRPSTVPVYSNTTGEPYPAEADALRGLLADQLANPVRFVEEIEFLYRSGVRTFLEVGPDAKLTGLVRSILDGRDHAAVGFDATRGSRGNLVDLARTLAQVAALGHAIDLSGWDRTEQIHPPIDRKPGLTVKVSGANFRAKPLPPMTKPAPVLQASSNSESPTKMTPKPEARPSHPQPNRNGSPAPQAAPAAPRAVARPTQPVAPRVPAVVANRIESPFLVEALRASQDNLIALQRISEQTSEIHRQYLEGQDRAQQNFHSLLEQQQRLTLAAIGMAPATPIASPAPQPAIESRPTPSAAPPIPRREVAARAQRPTSTPAPVPRPAPAPAVSRVVEPIPIPIPVTTPSPVAVADTSKVYQALVEVVSEKTGYPAEVLEPGMQLDADLGIDSIKRVEILAALQDRLPDAPVIGPEHLGTIRTLGQIVEFLGGGQSTTPVAIPTMVQPPSAAPAASASLVHQALVDVVSEKTGYPAEVLEPGMQLDADLGIDSIKRVEILAALQDRLPDAPVIGPEHLGTIRTLGQIVEFLAGEGSTPLVPPAIIAPTQKPTSEPPSVPVRRIVPSVVKLDGPDDRPTFKLATDAEVWVLDDGSELAASLLDALKANGRQARLLTANDLATVRFPAKLAGLILVASGPTRATMGEIFRLLRTAAPALRKGNSALVTVTELGGSFGIEGLAREADSRSGGLAGLSKTAGHEWPEVLCKAIDIDPALTKPLAASMILEEMAVRGPSEVGLTVAGRSTILLQSVPLETSAGVDRLKTGDLVVITGGARGVTAEVAVELARAFRPTIAILGRSPVPQPEPDWLKNLTEEAEIKRGLHTRANGHSSPKIIGEQFVQLAANREILTNLKRIEEAGASVVYRSVDVRDSKMVSETIATLQADLGPVRGIVHGAGVLADRKIEDQTDEQFARVYETKVGGLDALLEAVEPEGLRTLILFSSSTARFGRTGQVAYAAANEVLNKRAQLEARRLPECRVLSLNWGPWAGGMVTPSLRPLFEAEGIALIPVGEGAKYLVEELRTRQQSPVEVVILGGDRPDPEFLKPAPIEKTEELTSGLAKVFERPLDVASTPILESHVMDGRPVLPMALILEWLAQAAMTRNPGMVYRGVDELRLLKGVVLRETLPETIRAMAGKANRVNDYWVVPVELRGVLADDREVLHARGQVILGDSLAARPDPFEEPSLSSYSSSIREIYRDILFHGSDLHGIAAIEGCSDAGISASVNAAPHPSEWVVNPLRNQWLTDPLAIDCAFQMMILWSIERTGSGSLPTFIGGYRQFRRAFPTEGVRVVARVTDASAHKARADVDFLDEDGRLVARIEDYECVIDSSLKAAFRRNRAAHVESK